MCARRCARAAGSGVRSGSRRPRGTGALPRRGWAPPQRCATVAARRERVASTPTAPRSRPSRPRRRGAHRTLPPDARASRGRGRPPPARAHDGGTSDRQRQRRARPDRVPGREPGARAAGAGRTPRGGRASARQAPVARARRPPVAVLPLRDVRRDRSSRPAPRPAHDGRPPGARGHPRSWAPRSFKLPRGLEDGTGVAFRDARGLGRVRLRHDPRAGPPISLLGFDALHQLPPLRRLSALLGARAAPVKAVLLDQSFSAGVGNWIADEVLYQARIDPRRRAHTLTAAEVGRLRARLRSVVALAVRVGADSDRFPPKWLFHTRWSKRLKSPVTPRGERIRYLTVGGRTTAWVAEVQR